MPTGPPSNPDRDYSLSGLIIKIADRKVDELVGRLEYLNEARELIREAIAKIVTDIFSSNIFRDEIAAALKARYPDDLSDEIAGIISAGIAEAVRSAIYIPSILRKLVVRPDKETLERMLRENMGNVADLSNELGVARITVYKWLQKFGIDYKKRKKRSR